MPRLSKWNQAGWLKSRLVRSWLYGLGYSLTTFLLAWQVTPAETVTENLPVAYHYFFIVGILGSVWAQTTVATFLSESNAYEGVHMPLRHLVEHFSNLLLIFFAVLSLYTSNHFWQHVRWTMFYVATVLVLDLYVGYYSRKAGATGNATLLARMCSALVWKIDGISFLGLLIVSVMTAGLWYISVPLAGAKDTVETGHVLAQVFLSGAIGFHFLVTMWLIFRYLLEWDTHMSPAPVPQQPKPAQST